MLRNLGRALLWGAGGYVFGFLAGMLLVAQLSGNTHDKEVEAVMTGFFFVGPIVGVIGAVASLVWPEFKELPQKPLRCKRGRRGAFPPCTPDRTGCLANPRQQFP